MSQIPTNQPYWLGQNSTSSGININASDVISIGASNVTVTNPLVTATSVILVTPICPAGGLTGIPQILSRTAGSFVVNCPNYVANMKLCYFVVASVSNSGK